MFTCIFTIYGYIVHSQRDRLQVGMAKVIGLNPF